MKFLTEKKKLLSMIAMICLAAVFCVTAITALIDMFGQFRNMFASFGFFLLSASALIGSFLGVATAACYAGAAFFQWKQGDHKKILALAGTGSVSGGRSHGSKAENAWNLYHRRPGKGG